MGWGPQMKLLGAVKAIGARRAMVLFSLALQIFVQPLYATLRSKRFVHLNISPCSGRALLQRSSCVMRTLVNLEMLQSPDIELKSHTEDGDGLSMHKENYIF